MKRSNAERFMEKVEQLPVDSGCWLWSACCNEDGYGQFGWWTGDRYKTMGAHRVSWLLWRGDLPANREIRHRCHLPACVNPDHLSIGTHTENMDDMVRAGRSTHPERPQRLYGAYPRHGGRRWQAAIGHKGKLVHIGFFGTAEEANRASLAKRAELRGLELS